MARNKQSSGTPPGVAVSAGSPEAGVPGTRGMSAGALGSGPAILLAVMMFLAPSVGVPHEEMLQDTLKSMIVSFLALGTGLLFFWQQRNRQAPVRWHAVVWLPLMLMAYALGSMAWSHTYLAGVEAIRWFIFSLLVWLGLNTLSRERLPILALGIHAGAVVASLWAALQFLIDFKYFPQGPPPASTFVNRNFFAEFAVCTLPFGALLLARARVSGQAALLAGTSGFVIVAILMTGTRAALIALWLQLLLVLPYIGWLYRRQFEFPNWRAGTKAAVVAMFIGTVVGLGSVSTGNPKIIEEGLGITALERGFKRTGSISPNDSSLGIRMIMWKATMHMIGQRPVFGVGAGAWENDITLYQAEGSQLETDYYVHNEYLQLVAEYGVVGWLFLVALATYLLAALRRTLLDKSEEGLAEAPWRAILLCSLLSFFVVSNVGFPWRMASTGALFALCLAALAASDARLGFASRWGVAHLGWQPAYSQAALAGVAGALVLAGYISQAAVQSEQKIVRAAKIALTISASGRPNHSNWDRNKAEMLRLIREGVEINRHYRKITPMVADELARWGDWKNATWIWESVLSSRPNVVAIMSNVARGYIAMGDAAKADEWLQRAKKVQPRAPAVRSLEVVLLSRRGQLAQALDLARQSIDDEIYDYDLMNSAFRLASRAGDYPLATKAMQLRIAKWPQSQAQGLLELGLMYALSANDPPKALASFRQAMVLLPESQRSSLLAQIPASYRFQLEEDATLPAQPPAPPQTSASKG